MSSPFPGMDPFLEDPEVFPDFHERFTTNLSERIQSRLPPPYYARLGTRVWIESSARSIGPDVSLFRQGRDPRGEGRAGGVAVAEAPAGRGVIVHVPHDEYHEPFIEIYAGRGEERRLATAIEVLSRTNKTAGEYGRDLYLREQREVLAAQVHLVEIDLLRGGRHTTSVPRDRAVAAAGEFDYHVCVRRFDAFEDYVVYPILLQQRLPEIAVPLLPGDSPVLVDLQAVFDHCYTAGAYDREIDYGGGMAPALAVEMEEWVRSRLGGRG